MMLNHQPSDVVGETERAPPTEQPAERDGSETNTGTDDETERVTDWGTDDHPAAGARSISKDDAFHLLQNSRRRAVLRHLLANPDREQFRMRDVAEAVAAWENDTTPEHLASDQRQRVYIALYQSHLPKLDEEGIIEYNQPRGVVEPSPLLKVCEPFLEDGLDADAQSLAVEDGVSAGDANGNGDANGTGNADATRSGNADANGDATADADADGHTESDRQSGLTDVLSDLFSG